MQDLEKVYNSADHEQKIYTLWEKSGIFEPNDNNKKKTFTIIMPPPNANDNLHIGHARFVTIEDILIRYHRMLGEPTLWLPGADHAGIETQYVFEKKLSKEGKSRFDFDRDTLYKMIWDYVIGNKQSMENQLRRLGASCDWSRNTFTLDPKIVEIVYQTFKKLSNDGLIYRGNRIVNYCPRCGTAFSQLEVDSKEQQDFMYYLDYGSVVIATTRPETIFADVAIAVHPKLKSASKYKGKTAIVPLIDKEIPIIEDALVDPEFGTGALKITPGHDALDFEIGKKHSLPIISVIDKAGRMIGVPEKYVGMKALPAREAVVADLEAAGKLVKREPIKHVVGICYRDKGLIEPMISEQWFIKVRPLADKALNAINQGKVKFVASRYKKVAVHWLKNLDDWNISRQIVWGIQIPAWNCEKCGQWLITAGEKPAQCEKCGGAVTQDSDTFDTWFSSGQWPFAVLIQNSKNTQHKTRNTKQNDFERFYPTSVMETGFDILPFWVIRMIMLGLYATGDVPFREVIIHGLVRDKEGQKISKSKGNVINPLEMVDKYGADALRMGVIWGSLVENDIALSEDNIRGQRNFANKIWNIGRFVNISTCRNIDISKYQALTKDDKKILSELDKTIKQVTKALDSCRLNLAVETLYEFVWRQLADRYIEVAKKQLESDDSKIMENTLAILIHVYKTSLKLLHPFMPFLTETIWQELEFSKDEPMLIAAQWPVAE